MDDHGFVVQRPRHRRPFAGLAATRGTHRSSPLNNANGQITWPPWRLTPFGLRIIQHLAARKQLTTAPAHTKRTLPSCSRLHVDVFAWRPTMIEPRTGGIVVYVMRVLLSPRTLAYQRILQPPWTVEQLFDDHHQLAMEPPEKGDSSRAQRTVANLKLAAIVWK